MPLNVDFLVIGSGIAGLSYALKVAEHGTVCVATKSKIEDTSTKYAQGGIASVTYKPDSVEKHMYDTEQAGGFLNNEAVVQMVVEKGPSRVSDLIEWGARFDKEANGQFDLHKEGGHSEKRVLHHKDNTGYEIQRALSDRVINHPRITVLENHFSVDIITQHHLGKEVRRNTPGIECYGAYVFDIEQKRIFKVLAKNTLIATGGCGNVYMNTTNPEVITGDGIAMAYRAKGIIENMEFVQFHPTALYNPGEKPAFLITEAMRGAGAILKNIQGKEFMNTYDPRGSLAPRDIVARTIDNEMKMSGSDHVYLDATSMNSLQIKKNFPNIYNKCLEVGVDPSIDYIPVVPSAHYCCGGIKTDINGESSIRHLFAVGEVASSGLHGANRLASNSLLEAVVFSDQAAKKSISDLDSIEFEKNIPDWDDTGTVHNEELVLITQSQREMQQTMSNYVGIVRSDLRLERARNRLAIIYEETWALYKKSKLTVQICELRNMINVAYLIIKMAQQRKQSIGLHYNIDYKNN